MDPLQPDGTAVANLHPEGQMRLLGRNHAALLNISKNKSEYEKYINKREKQ